MFLICGNEFLIKTSLLRVASSMVIKSMWMKVTLSPCTSQCRGGKVGGEASVWIYCIFAGYPEHCYFF